MKLAALFVLVASCAHPARKADPEAKGPSREDLAKVAVTVAPEASF